MRARAAMELFGGYSGASKSRRGVKNWTPLGNDADSDILPDLDTLRERSRDLVRNNAIAAAAIKTKVTSVIGTGLRLQSRVDRQALGLDDSTADELETLIEREWRLFFETKDVDVSRTLTGHGIVRQVYQQALENGDVFILLPRLRSKSPYSLRLQVVEADRVCNKDNVSDTATLSGGIEKDSHGAPVAAHILKSHPGNSYLGGTREWEVRPFFGQKTGLRNIIHFFTQTRPGQARGVPDLAPVIEPIKQLGKYTEAEVMAAVVSGMFTVFVESESGDSGFDYTNLGDEVGRDSSDKDIKLGSGLVVELAAGEKVHDTNPGRPNTSFDPFVTAVLRQVGAAIEIPFEILSRHFTNSYSAARAALLSLWQYVQSERRHLEDDFLKLIYEVWMHEAVLSGRIHAPGFLADPGVRAAYLGCRFIGPSKGQINEKAEVDAAQARIDGGLSTLADETAELTGRDWEDNHRQQVKERKKRLKDGLIEAGEAKNVEEN